MNIFYKSGNIFFFLFFLDLSKIGSVLLSASVKRVGVSRMQDLKNYFGRGKTDAFFCIFVWYSIVYLHGRTLPRYQYYFFEGLGLYDLRWVKQYILFMIFFYF